MTSNIGSDIILEAKSITDEVKHKIEHLLQKSFRPEFLNRIDSVIFFKSLTQKDVEAIAHIQLKEVQQRLAEKHITMTVTPEVYKKIAELGYSPEFGARPLKRAIQNYVTVPLSQFVLKNPDAKEIKIGIKGDSINIE
jgi:ATP-dependent Clp protease ATP-binding subunit ClpB